MNNAKTLIINTLTEEAYAKITPTTGQLYIIDDDNVNRTVMPSYDLFSVKIEQTEDRMDGMSALYDPTACAIRLVNISGETLSEFDAGPFISDNYLSSAVLHDGKLLLRVAYAGKTGTVISNEISVDFPVDTELSNSGNPVQNRPVYNAITGIYLSVDEISAAVGDIKDSLDSLILSVDGISTMAALSVAQMSNDIALSVDGISTMVALSIGQMSSAVALSVDGISTMTKISVDTMSAYLHDEINSVELSINGISTMTALSVAQMSNTVSLSVDGISTMTALSVAEMSNIVSLSVDGISTMVALSIGQMSSAVALSVDGISTMVALSIGQMSSAVALSVDGISTMTALSVAEMSSAVALSVDGISTMAALSVAQMSNAVALSVDGISTMTALSIAEMSNAVALSTEGISTMAALSVDGISTMTKLSVSTMSAYLDGKIKAIDLSVNGISTMTALSVAGISAYVSNLDTEFVAGTCQIPDTVKQADGKIEVTFKTLGVDGVDGLAARLATDEGNIQVNTANIAAAKADITQNASNITALQESNKTITKELSDEKTARSTADQALFDRFAQYVETKYVKNWASVDENNLIVTQNDLKAFDNVMSFKGTTSVDISADWAKDPTQKGTYDSGDVLVNLSSGLEWLLTYQETEGYKWEQLGDQNGLTAKYASLTSQIYKTSSDIVLSVDGISTMAALSVAQMSNTVSLSVDGISTMTALSVNQMSGIIALSVNQMSGIIALSVNQMSGIIALSVDRISTMTKISVDTMSAYLNSEISNIELSINGISAETALSAAGISGAVQLSVAEIEKEIAEESGIRNSADAYLSGKIENKVKVGEYGKALTAVDELSIVKISDSNYYTGVCTSSLNEQTLYIVSSDMFNAFGGRIINVATPISGMDAVNLSTMNNTVSAVSTDYTQKITNVENSLSGYISISAFDTAWQNGLSDIAGKTYGEIDYQQAFKAILAVADAISVLRSK